MPENPLAIFCEQCAKRRIICFAQSFKEAYFLSKVSVLIKLCVGGLNGYFYRIVERVHT